MELTNVLLGNDTTVQVNEHGTVVMNCNKCNEKISCVAPDKLRRFFEERYKSLLASETITPEYRKQLETMGVPGFIDTDFTNYAKQYRCEKCSRPSTLEGGLSSVGNPFPSTPNSEREYDGGKFYSGE